jgi:hypothetical protein
MVMHPVDRGRDDKARERGLEPHRQTQIRVMKDGGNQNQRLEDEDRAQGKTDRQDHAGAREGRDQHLAEMEPQRGG